MKMWADPTKQRSEDNGMGWGDWVLLISNDRRGPSVPVCVHAPRVFCLV